MANNPQQPNEMLIHPLVTEGHRWYNPPLFEYLRALRLYAQQLTGPTTVTNVTSAAEKAKWYVDDVLIGTRRGGNFKAGQNVILSGVDDGSGDKVDITINALGFNPDLIGTGTMLGTLLNMTPGGSDWSVWASNTTAPPTGIPTTPFLSPSGGWLTRMAVNIWGAENAHALERFGQYRNGERKWRGVITPSAAIGVYGDTIVEAFRAEAGDDLRMPFHVGGGLTTAKYSAVSCEFISDDGSWTVGLHRGAAGSSIPGSTTQFLNLFAPGIQTDSGRTAFVIPFACTAKRMFVQMGTGAQPADGSLVITV